MALNVISNFAANVAHRNLAAADAGATDSVSKLSSGQRVNSARDDAASLAIGSRLRAEVVALRTASVNANQAGSLLQIADGALSTVADILVRMKELAVQASSGQFSSIERGVLDSEFQALSSEITRISQDTEFNGTKLISGGAATATTQLADNFAKSGNGFAVTVDPAVVADNTALRLSYDRVLAQAQISTTTVAGTIAIGDVFTIRVTDNAAGQTYTATYTSTVAGNTATEHNSIRDGLIAAVNNIVGVTVTAAANGNGVVQLTAKTAGNGFSSTTSTTSALGTISAIATPTPNIVGGNFLTLYNLSNGTNQTVDVAPIIDGVAAAGAGQNLALTETAKVTFNSLGVVVTLDANFDRNTDHITTGTAVNNTAASRTFNGLTFTNDSNGGVANDAITALLASGAFDATTGLLSLSVGGNATFTTLTAAGIKLGVDGAGPGALGGTTADLEDGAAHTVEIYVTNANGLDILLGQISLTSVAVSGGVASGTLDIDVGALLFGADVVKGSSTQSFSFKVGSGSETYDSLTFSVSAASASSLGVLGTAQGGSLGITTAALADAASAAVSAAIDTLNQTRSDIGAAQNRLTFAAANLATAIENAEVARSGLLDLDVAQEISTFTSKQILVQTGVATLAQANQLPQNLLRLFQ